MLSTCAWQKLISSCCSACTKSMCMVTAGSRPSNISRGMFWNIIEVSFSVDNGDFYIVFRIFTDFSALPQARRNCSLVLKLLEYLTFSIPFRFEKKCVLSEQYAVNSDTACTAPQRPQGWQKAVFNCPLVFANLFESMVPNTPPNIPPPMNRAASVQSIKPSKA